VVTAVSNLLHEAAEVQRLCDELLALPEPLNDEQQRDVAKITNAAERFLSLVTETADFLQDSPTQEIRTLSHELRTPIVGICGFAELLLFDLNGPLSEKQRDYLNRINGCGEKLGGLINDMMQEHEA
jgi:signal transduction histidine kinase